MLYTLPIKTNLSRDKHGNGVTYGRVEKTDPRSADYPKKSTKFLLRSTKIQKAYLLFLHDHNCTKNSRHFLFQHFSTQSFSFC